MTQLIRGAPSIGITTKGVVDNSATLPSYGGGQTNSEIIEYLLSKVAAMTTVIEGKADSKKLKTIIAYSDEAVRIQAEEIALIGNVTFLDVWRDQTGQVIGGVHPSLTQIRGGVVRTGIIQSVNLTTTTGSQFNLDTGDLLIGGTSSPKLYFNGTTGNLDIKGTLTAGAVIAGSVTVTGVPGFPTIADLAAGGSGLDAAGVQALLTAGVTNILAGTGGDYRLDVNSSGSSITLRHASAQYNTTIGSYAGALRTGLAITANGIAAGYNRTSDGAWVNAFAIDSGGNATFGGTITANSIIANSATVNGVALGTVQTQASAGNAHISSTGNVHSISTSQLLGDLGGIADSATYFKTTLSEKQGGAKGNLGLDSSGKYIKEISTQLITVSGSNPANGLVIDSAGLRGYQSSTLKFSIPVSGNPYFAGDINTAGQVFASGGNTYAGQVASIHGVCTTTLGVGVYGEGPTTGIGVFGKGNSGGAGVQGESTSSGTGVIGRSLGSGVGVFAQSSSGEALYVSGSMIISSSSLVANLNANYLQGNSASAFAAASHTHNISDLQSASNWVKIETSTDGVNVAQSIYFRRINW